MTEVEIVMRTMEEHRMAHAWAYGGTNIKHGEMYDYGMRCHCGWSFRTNDADEFHDRRARHEAEAIMEALTKAGTR